MGLNESIPIDEKEFGFRLYKVFPGPLDKAGLKENNSPWRNI